MSDPYIRAARALQEALQAPRVLILKGNAGAWQVAASLGLEGTRLEEATVSLSAMDEVARTGTALMVTDVNEEVHGPRFSLLMGQVQSFTCLPWWAPGAVLAGVLYADTTSRTGFFSPAHLASAQRVARQLESEVFGSSHPDPEPEARMETRRKPSSAPLPAPAQAARPLPLTARAIEERAIWLRSLALMLESGVTFLRAFEVLAESSPKPEHRQALQLILKALSQGRPLYQAMCEPAGIFSRVQVQLTRAGEASGSLVLVLRRLADHEDKYRQHRQRLRGALVYPAFVLSLSTLLLGTLTPWVLRGQLQLLEKAGQALPWPTRMLAVWSQYPAVSALLLAMLLGGAFLALRRWLALPSSSRVLLKMPALGPLLRSSASWRFCQSFALLNEAGISLPETLRYAAEASLYPPLQENQQRILQSILDGSTVAEAIAAYAGLGRLVSETIRVGEETGKMSEMLQHTANLAELQFDSALESWSQLLEPILVVLMGLFVGAVLLATLAPTIALLQNL